MVHNADNSDDFSNRFDSVHALDIAGVTDYHWSFSLLVSASNSSDLSIANNDFINFSIEHVGASVDGAQSAERLWKTSKTVDRVQERRVSVLAKGFVVEGALLNCFDSRLV